MTTHIVWRPIRAASARCVFFALMASSVLAQTNPPAEPSSAQKLREANTGFAFRYFRTVAEARPTENIMLMPWGLSYTFGLLQNGASPTARQEIDSAFGFGGLSQDEINEAFSYLHLRLAGRPGPRTPPKRPLRLADMGEYQGLRFSSYLWLRSPMHFRSEFLAVNEKYYQHSLRVLPANERAALQEVGAAVRTDTADLIRYVFPTLEREHFVLFTTTHLQCDWGKPFEPQKTKEEPFYMLTGDVKMVPMMADDGLYRYMRGEQFQAVEMYCSNCRLQIFLPDKDSSLEALRGELNLSNWRAWTGSMTQNYLLLKLPRFRITSSEDIRQHVERMGVKQIFSYPESLLPMVTAKEGALLTQGLEKAALEVDERGMEAGSAVGFGGILGGILAGQPPPEFVVDRPFLFVISNWDGTVLYIGMTVDPEPLKPHGERK